MFNTGKGGWKIFSLKTGKRNFTGLLQKFNKYLMDSNIMSNRVTRKMASSIVKDTRININSSVGKLSGELESSVYYKKISGKETTYEVGVSAPHAEYPEFGTGKYNIFGKGRKDGWVYHDDFSNEFYYTEGQKPKLFFNRALDKNLGRFSNLLKTEVRRHIR